MAIAYIQHLDVSVNVLIWGEIESCCSIIAACLPSYGPLLQGSNFLKPLMRGLSSVLSMLNSRRTQASSIMSFRRVYEASATTTSKESASASDIQGSWYPLKDVSHITTISQDVESGLRRDTRDITVERSFTSRVEAR
jgi:hypothetical protein